MKYLFFSLLFLLPLSAHFDEQDLKNFEKKCMVCHDTYVQNDMAPPIIAINQRYKKYYGDIDYQLIKLETFSYLQVIKMLLCNLQLNYII